MTRILASLAAIAVLAAPLAAFAQSAVDVAAPVAPPAVVIPTIARAGDLVDTMKASGQFTILLKALDASNLTALLKSAGPLTILAPTDAAFNALPAGQLDSLLKVENAAQLQGLLVNHLVNAAVTPDKFKGGKVPIRNVGNVDLQFDGAANPPTINGATIIGEGVATNGDIYAIDKVLAPAG